LEDGACRLRRVGTGRIDDLHLRSGAPADLLDLLFQRHARKQVSDAVLDGKTGVAVLGRGLGRGGLRSLVLSGERHRTEHGNSECRAEENIDFHKGSEKVGSFGRTIWYSEIRKWARKVAGKKET